MYLKNLCTYSGNYFKLPIRYRSIGIYYELCFNFFYTNHSILNLFSSPIRYKNTSIKNKLIYLSVLLCGFET